MELTIKRERSFEVTETILEVLGFLHGAIDPDSGHIVCHHYRFGVAAIDVGGKPVPLFSIEGCIFLTAGEENTRLILENSGAVKVEELRISGGNIAVGDVSVESYWALLALSFVRELGGKIYTYKIPVNLDGRAVKAAGILVRPKDSYPVLIILPSKCAYERKEVATHM